MQETIIKNPLYLQSKDLLAHFEAIGSPLPFSFSSIEKDRKDARLGGIPYRIIGRQCVYEVSEVLNFLAGKPIFQARRAITESKAGRPTKKEQITARNRGVSVQELRAGA